MQITVKLVEERQTSERGECDCSNYHKTRKSLVGRHGTHKESTLYHCVVPNMHS